MTTFQSTDWRIKVEPIVSASNDYEKGPSVDMEHTSLVLTHEAMRELGHYAPRANDKWECYLFWYQVIDSVLTGINLSEFTASAKYWDPILKTGGDITIELDADQVINAGKARLSIATVPGNIIPVGNYQFEVVFTQNNQNRTGASGWLEVRPARPSV